MEEKSKFQKFFELAKRTPHEVILSIIIMLLSVCLLISLISQFKLVDRQKEKGDITTEAILTDPPTEAMTSKNRTSLFASSDAAMDPKQIETTNNNREESTEYAPALVEMPLPSITLTNSAKVEEVLTSMSLEEKIYQLFIVTPEVLLDNSVSCVQISGEATHVALQQKPVAGLVYFSQNLDNRKQTIEMIANAQTFAKEQKKIGLLIAVDEEGGKVARVASKLGTTKYSPMGVYGKKADIAQIQAIGENISADIAQFGFNLDFAPVADVNTNPGNELADRIFSSDPSIVSDMSAAMVKGLQSTGTVSATLKHFPGLGGENGNTHYDSFVRINRTMDELRETEFKAFRGGIEANVDCVLVGHQIISCAGDELPADLSHVIVTDWLRGELGYQGIVITDAQNMKTISGVYSTGTAAKMSIEAGVDIVLMPTDLNEAFIAVFNAVQNGEISEDRIDESVRRILIVKDKHGLLD